MSFDLSGKDVLRIVDEMVQRDWLGLQQADRDELVALGVEHVFLKLKPAYDSARNDSPEAFLRVVLPLRLKGIAQRLIAERDAAVPKDPLALDDGGIDDSDDVAGKAPPGGEHPRADITGLRWRGRAQLEANSHWFNGASDMADVIDRRQGNDRADLPALGKKHGFVFLKSLEGNAPLADYARSLRIHHRRQDWVAAEETLCAISRLVSYKPYSSMKAWLRSDSDDSPISMQDRYRIGSVVDLYHHRGRVSRDDLVGVSLQKLAALCPMIRRGEIEPAKALELARTLSIRALRSRARAA